MYFVRDISKDAIYFWYISPKARYVKNEKKEFISYRNGARWSYIAFEQSENISHERSEYIARKTGIQIIQPLYKDCRNEERNMIMWILMLALTILNLIFVYKNKSLISKITSVLTIILYVILSWHNILNVIIMIKSGIVGVQVLLWDIVNVVLLISLCISIFKNYRRVSLWLLWFMIFILFIGNWNTWLIYIIYLKSILRWFFVLTWLELVDKKSSI